MTYIAVMNWNANNRVTKYQEFSVQVEAETFAARGGSLPGTRVEAFAVQRPSGDVFEWSVNSFTKTLTYSPPPVVKPTVIPKDEFVDRFTDAELNGILAAGRTDVQVARWLEKARGAGGIDLTSPKVAAGMALLVSKGLVTAERKTEILTP